MVTMKKYDKGSQYSVRDVLAEVIEKNRSRIVRGISEGKESGGADESSLDDVLAFESLQVQVMADDDQ